MACGLPFRVSLAKSKFRLGNLKLCYRLMITKHSGGVDYLDPPSFNYLRLGYSADRFHDRTYRRFNDNTKVIAVDGSIGVGKGHVAEKLAEAFDLSYVPDVTEEDIWISHWFDEPIDFREHNLMLPDSAKYYTLPMFWNDKNPIEKGKPLGLQYQYLIARHWNYCVAMCHLFNTGRGFVMDRSPHSDFAFAKAMTDCGFMSQEAYDWYYFARRNTVPTLWKPHVVVYLRAPLELVKQRIAERKVPWELSSPNLSDKFLLALQKSLENDYVDRMRQYSEVYEVNLDEMDVNDEEDIACIVEEISQLDLEGHGLDDYDKKFLQWRDGLHNRDIMDFNRWIMSNSTLVFGQYFDAMRVPLALKEAKYSYEDQALQLRLLEMDPRADFPAGFSLKRNSMAARLFGYKTVPHNFEVQGHQSYLFK